jgi:hypothetical protein
VEADGVGVGDGDVGDGGGVALDDTVTVVVVDAVAPALSVIVKFNVYVPAVAYECAAVTPLPCVPSPHVHTYDWIEPVGATDWLPLTLTGEPAVPVYGPPAFADGRTVRAADAVSAVDV